MSNNNNLTTWICGGIIFIPLLIAGMFFALGWFARGRRDLIKKLMQERLQPFDRENENG